MSEQGSTEIIVESTVEGNLQIIEAVSQLIDKKNPEEFVFSCGKWGIHWIKIVYRKGKKTKIKTRDN